MGRPLPKAPIEELIRIVGQFPGGASLEQILPHVTTPRRTVQYRLAALVTLGRLTSIGHTRGTRYRVAASLASPQSAGTELLAARPTTAVAV